MNKGIVKVSEILPVGLLADLKRPIIEKSDRPKLDNPPRVVGDPTRTPVDYQAAKMLFRSSWIYKPLPPAPEIKPELERLREENARLKATNEHVIRENSVLRNRVEKLTRLNESRTTKFIPTSVPAPFPAKSKKKQLLERLTDGK